MKKIVFFNFLFVVFSLFYPGISSGEEIFDPIGKRFHGEVLKYDFGFWVFHRVGEGIAAFRSLGNGKYEAIHDGRTLGFVGWITRHRRDFYHSTMTTMNNGKKLIPLRFEEDVLIGLKLRKRVTTYDYAQKKVLIETEKEGKMTREEVEIPFGVLYDDPMTAFYNFRFGVYGEVEPGKEFVILTVPREESPKDIRLTVASKEEEDEMRATEAEKENKDLFIKVQLDKELVGSLQGRVYAWFSKDVVPVAGVAKDVFFYGDVIGKLTYQGFTRSPEEIKFFP